VFAAFSQLVSSHPSLLTSFFPFYYSWVHRSVQPVDVAFWVYSISSNSSNHATAILHKSNLTVHGTSEQFPSPTNSTILPIISSARSAVFSDPTMYPFGLIADYLSLSLSFSQALVVALSHVRDQNDNSPSVCHQFFLDQLVYNDNSLNPVSVVAHHWPRMPDLLYIRP
jgi:hypothetical protein